MFNFQLCALTERSAAWACRIRSHPRQPHPDLYSNLCWLRSLAPLQTAARGYYGADAVGPRKDHFVVQKRRLSPAQGGQPPVLAPLLRFFAPFTHVHVCAVSQAVLDRLAQVPEFTSNPRAFLEVPDGEGNTPLVIASSRGHYQVAELLLQRGASLSTQNNRPEGGSALHEAVARRQDHIADLLLRHGANPFVENAKGFTAMDLACSTRNVDLLRQIETHAQWRGWLMQKVTRLGGLGTEWQRRWVVICHRLPSPFEPPARQVTHVVLLCYKNTTNTAPACRVWLDGAKTVEVQNQRALERTGGRTPAQLELHLHHRLRAPTGAYYTRGSRDRVVLHFRPDEGTQLECDALRAWGAVVNNPRAAAGTGSGGWTAPPPAPLHHHLGSTAANPPPQAAQPTPPPRPAAPTTASITPPAPLQAQGSDPRYSPLGQGASGIVDVAALDAEFARRLQTEEDERMAQQMASMPPAAADALGTEAQPSWPPPQRIETAPSTLPPPITQPSGDFYPSINFTHTSQAEGRPGGASGVVVGRPGVGVSSPFASPSMSPSVMPSAPTDSTMQSNGGSGSAARIFGVGGAAVAAPGPRPAPAAAARPAAAIASDDGDRAVCCICLDSPINTAFTHGDM